METRSQTRQLYSQRHSYPKASSDSTKSSNQSSAFNSSSSLSFTPTSSAASSTPSSVNMPQQLSSAPMPSPSCAQRQNYFGSMSAQGPTSHPELQPSQQHRTSVSQQHVGQRGNGNGLPETAPFLQDFNLVAEAAKRAQTACLMRDFGDMEL